MKIGSGDVSEFLKSLATKRNGIIAAAVGGAAVLVGLGVVIGRSGEPKTEVVEQTIPPYFSDVRLSPSAKAEADMMARAAMMFLFLHETGHMLISEEKLPVVGPEEDVVDEYATFMLTDIMKQAPERAKNLFAQIVIGGALFWKISAANRGGAATPFYDEHAPDEKRFYNILCLATGADPVRFIPLAVKNGVPEVRLQKCAREYDKKHEALQTIMAPHEKSWLSRALGLGGRMKLKIGPVGKSEWLPYEITYRASGNFQLMLDGLSDMYDLPEDIPVEVGTCNGVVNAFWSADDKKITLCHELFEQVEQLFARTFAAVEQQQLANAGGGQGGGQPMPPGGGGNVPMPIGGGQGGNTVAFLTGRWVCNAMAPNGVTGTSETALTSDGAFTMREQHSNGMAMQAWGRWSTPSPNTIRYDFQGVNPPQLCGAQGCVPTVQNPTLVAYRVTGPNSISTQGSTCNKAG